MTNKTSTPRVSSGEIIRSKKISKKIKLPTDTYLCLNTWESERLKVQGATDTTFYDWGYYSPEINGYIAAQERIPYYSDEQLAAYLGIPTEYEGMKLVLDREKLEDKILNEGDSTPKASKLPERR